MKTRLKKIRDESGLNMRDFAERIGMSHGAISLLESGKRNMTSQFINSVCREFNVRKEWLERGEGEMYEPSSREIEIAEIASEIFNKDHFDPEADRNMLDLIKTISKMSPDQVEALYNVAKNFKEKGTPD